MMRPSTVQEGSSRPQQHNRKGGNNSGVMVNGGNSDGSRMPPLASSYSSTPHASRAATPSSNMAMRHQDRRGSPSPSASSRPASRAQTPGQQSCGGRVTPNFGHQFKTVTHPTRSLLHFEKGRSVGLNLHRLPSPDPEHDYATSILLGGNHPQNPFRHMNKEYIESLKQDNNAAARRQREKEERDFQVALARESAKYGGGGGAKEEEEAGKEGGGGGGGRRRSVSTTTGMTPPPSRGSMASRGTLQSQQSANRSTTASKTQKRSAIEQGLECEQKEFSLHINGDYTSPFEGLSDFKDLDNNDFTDYELAEFQHRRVKAFLAKKERVKLIRKKQQQQKSSSNTGGGGGMSPPKLLGASATDSDTPTSTPATATTTRYDKEDNDDDNDSVMLHTSDDDDDDDISHHLLKSPHKRQLLAQSVCESGPAGAAAIAPLLLVNACNDNGDEMDGAMMTDGGFTSSNNLGRRPTTSDTTDQLVKSIIQEHQQRKQSVTTTGAVGTNSSRLVGSRMGGRASPSVTPKDAGLSISQQQQHPSYHFLSVGGEHNRRLSVGSVGSSSTAAAAATPSNDVRRRQTALLEVLSGQDGLSTLPQSSFAPPKIILMMFRFTNVRNLTATKALRRVGYPELHEQFNIIATNGVITKHQYNTVLQKYLGPVELLDAHRILNCFDKTALGDVDVNMFLIGLQILLECATPADTMRYCFTLMDTNNKIPRYITRYEIQTLLGYSSPSSKTNTTSSSPSTKTTTRNNRKNRSSESEDPSDREYLRMSEAIAEVLQETHRYDYMGRMPLKGFLEALNDKITATVSGGKGGGGGGGGKQKQKGEFMFGSAWQGAPVVAAVHRMSSKKMLYASLAPQRNPKDPHAIDPDEEL